MIPDHFAQLPEPTGRPEERRWTYGLYRALFLVALLVLPSLLDPLSRIAASEPRWATERSVVHSDAGGILTTYAYNSVDWLTETGGAFVSTSFYGDNGNRTGVCYTPSCTTPTDTFAYDWNNRLTGATVDGTSASYAYAGDDLRASRTQGGTTTTYLWDRIGALPTVVGDGTLRSVHGPSGLLNEASGTTGRYPLQDALGSIRLRTNASGAAIGTASWDVWGNPRATSGTQGSFGWTGELKDPTTNLVYLRARDYAPGSGRFLTRDTLETSGPGTQGYNRYAFALNNPVSRVDPSGHASIQARTYAAWTTGLGLTAFAFSAFVTGSAGALAAVAAAPVMTFVLVALIFLTLVLIYDLVLPCVEAARQQTCDGKGEGFSLATLVDKTWEVTTDVGAGVTKLGQNIIDEINSIRPSPDPPTPPWGKGPFWPWIVTVVITTVIMPIVGPGGSPGGNPQPQPSPAPTASPNPTPTPSPTPSDPSCRTTTHHPHKSKYTGALRVHGLTDCRVDPDVTFASVETSLYLNGTRVGWDLDKGVNLAESTADGPCQSGNYFAESEHIVVKNGVTTPFKSDSTRQVACP